MKASAAQNFIEQRDRATERFLKSSDGALIMEDLKKQFGKVVRDESVQMMGRDVGHHDVLNYIIKNGERKHDKDS